jgi:hypothetical protein
VVVVKVGVQVTEGYRKVCDTRAYSPVELPPLEAVTRGGGGEGGGGEGGGEGYRRLQKGVEWCVPEGPYSPVELLLPEAVTGGGGVGEGGGETDAVLTVLPEPPPMVH